MTITLDDIRELSVDERLDLMDLIWDTIYAEPGEDELTDEQRVELHRRIEEHKRNPSEGYAWEEVRRSIEQRSEL